MKSFVKNAFHFSRLRPAGSIARVDRRHYHSNSIPIIKTIDDETIVKVKVGLAAQVELRVRQPPRPEANSPVILFLKPGVPTATQNKFDINNLAIAANAIAVEINYRVSARDGYPTPIHTVLAGYDWARANLTRGQTAYPELMMTTKPSKIGVCGELVGGSLATMLALTECFAELEPQGISALAVGNPILDWTALTASDATRNAPHGGVFRKIASFPDGAHNESLSANGLLDIRRAYFLKAETFFDPFASPLLFFRTPSSEIPNEATSPAEHDLLNGGPEESDPLLPPVKKRRSARRYPPTSSNLLFPWTLVEVGKDWVLRDQGVDLVELMQKSINRSEVEQIADAKNAIRRDFEVVERDGIGLWDEKHALEIGQWFGEILRKP